MAEETKLVCAVCGEKVQPKTKWELGSFVFDKKSCLDSYREKIKEKRQENEKRKQDDAKQNPNTLRFVLSDSKSPPSLGSNRFTLVTDCD